MKMTIRIKVNDFCNIFPMIRELKKQYEENGLANVEVIFECEV